MNAGKRQRHRTSSHDRFIFLVFIFHHVYTIFNNILNEKKALHAYDDTQRPWFIHHDNGSDATHHFPGRSRTLYLQASGTGLDRPMVEYPQLPRCHAVSAFSVDSINEGLYPPFRHHKSSYDIFLSTTSCNDYLNSSRRKNILRKKL